ncbi:MAG: hypothetical protein Q9227_007566 [Pyrenula ochraceoflavens]
MPSIAPRRADPSHVLNQLIISPSDTDYLDQLIPSIREYGYGNRTAQLLQSLQDFAAEKETEIERMCNSNHQEFVTSVNQLLRIREGTVKLTGEILNLNQSIQSSTEKLVEQKKALVESRGVRQNIDEAGRALRGCLDVLQLANQVRELLSKKSYYAALRALDELQNIHLRSVTQYNIADLIQKSVPSTQKAIAEAVMADLNTWLFRIREMSQYLGELSFYATDLRKQRQKERSEKAPYFGHFRLNSAIELVSDEHEEFDLLDCDELTVDFTPLFECLHIHQSLGQMDTFRANYGATRKQQRDLVLNNPTFSLQDEELADLHTLLENVAGFAIVEKVTMKKAPELRTRNEVDEIWDSLCQGAIGLITRTLQQIDNAENLLKVKNLVALFIQTMQSWNYPVTAFNGFLLSLFEKYAALLKKRFSDDFLEIVSTDDYLPMPIQNEEEFEKVVNVSWYTPEQPAEQIKFPCVLPFSQMYPLCCIDIRNFRSQIYFFTNDDFQNPEIVDETLETALDELLCDKVCDSLINRLSVQYLGQISQIFVNLGHFEIACEELEKLLTTSRTSSSIASANGPVRLSATEKFRAHKKTAEKRIFELVNSKIDDLIETAEYNWTAPGSNPQPEPSNYIQTLTRYLSNIMASMLLSLPTEIKELIYFDALSHAADMILSLPLSSDVKRINPNGVASLSKDVSYLISFVEDLGNPILLQNLDELQQTVQLMQAENSDEFYDVSMRNKKYGRVNPMNGPLLLEKLTHSVEAPSSAADRFAGLAGRFGIKG